MDPHVQNLSKRSESRLVQSQVGLWSGGHWVCQLSIAGNPAAGLAVGHLSIVTPHAIFLFIRRRLRIGPGMLFPSYPEYVVPGACVCLSLFMDRLVVSGSYFLFRMIKLFPRGLSNSSI